MSKSSPISQFGCPIIFCRSKKKFGHRNFSLLGPQKDVISNIYQNKVQIRINTFARFTQKYSVILQQKPYKIKHKKRMENTQKKTLPLQDNLVAT